jgi:peptidyl-prolyl cis-trans isomerase C
MSHSVSTAKSRRRALLSAPLALTLALATLVPVTALRADDATPAAPAGQVPAAPAPTAGAPDAKPIDPKTVVARINGKDITRQDVIESANNLPPQIKANLEMVFPQLTERLVGLTLITAEGRSEKLQDDPEVKAIVQKFEDEAIRQVFLNRLVKSKITDDAVKAKYDADLKAHPPQDEVKVAHILVKTEAEANAVLADLKKGTDFAKEAKDKSIDKGSAVNGGDLGMYFSQNGGEVVQPFADAAFALKNGEVSAKPVQTQFGWHIIKVEDRRKQTPPSFDQQKDQLRQQLAEDLVQAEVKDLRGKAKVELFNPDGTPIKQ